MASGLVLGCGMSYDSPCHRHHRTTLNPWKIQGTIRNKPINHTFLAVHIRVDPDKLHFKWQCGKSSLRKGIVIFPEMGVFLVYTPENALYKEINLHCMK